MLWRVRTTLPDRPGALALLAEQCGLADINILGLQIFPGIGAVTDELVLRTPEEWDAARLVALVEGAGGLGVRALRCTEAALADQPTRYVRAAQQVLEEPHRFPEVVARLFDAAAEPPEVETGVADPAQVMELAIGEVQVLLHRSMPFTATELARGAALADLVADALAHAAPAAPAAHVGAMPAYAVQPPVVRAVVDGAEIGRAMLGEEVEEGVPAISLRVEPAWRRRGVGTRLLVEVSRLAQSAGASEVVLRTSAGNQAVLPMVLAAGLRGRIRLAGDELSVRVPVRELRPLAR
ncbi:GNAT family N-acetyltransferase [Nocardioides flavescens]|uniref:GNAT family N-acetyltransferase n=1 Tax=Nocardioides flavescens TaxID=2691959 RepID=A0A6L7EZJ8_9ACTN|nr:GNAT family N-acetyltransferase [Nocardioides flavescens]MXG89381.1 GNAT family N-acetyltransferase [Nocardioides flavescens]